MTLFDPTKREFYDKEISWITEDIALSSCLCAMNGDFIKDEGIRTVIGIGGMQVKSVPEGVEHVKFPSIIDRTDDFSTSDIIAFLTAIKKATDDGKVLVHCLAGISRSPGFVTLHLCVNEGMEWEDAKKLVMAKRDIVDIHPLIERRLKEFLREQK